MKVLFISHQATRTGAPASLLALMTYFREKCGWDMRTLLATGGPHEAAFARVAPTERFDRYIRFKGQQSAVRSRIMLAKIMVYRLRNGWRPRKAWTYFMHEWRVRTAAVRQAKHEEALRARLLKWRPDIIYSNTVTNGPMLRALDLGVPVVVHARELAPMWRRLSDDGRRSLVEDPVWYLAVSEAVRDDLVSDLGIAGDKISIAPVALIPGDIEHLAQAVSCEDIRRELGAAPGDILVGGVGTTIPRKGCASMIRVAGQCMSAAQRIVFAWVGDGRFLQDYQRQASHLDNIRFVGERTNPYPYIRAFDILLMCSRCDPFPRVNLEAGLLRTPVVAFRNSGGSREYIENDAGIVVEGHGAEGMAEAAIRLAEDAGLRQRMGERGRQKVLERYNISTVAPRIAEQVEAIVRDHGRQKDVASPS